MKETKKLTRIGGKSINLTIEYPTHVLVVSQGDNEIKLTKDQVNDLRMLKEGTKYKDGVFTSQFPSNRFEKYDNGNIIIKAVSEFNDGIVVLNSDQVDKVVRFKDKHRPKITWTRDLIKKGIVY